VHIFAYGVWGGNSKSGAMGAVEGVHADTVEAAHLAHPAGMVMGRLADAVEPERAVQRVAGDGDTKPAGPA
jgi:hypothetical protein